MKRKNKVLFAAPVLLLIGTFMVIGLTGNDYVNFPMAANAGTSSTSENSIPGQSFQEINELAKSYKASPSQAAARTLVSKAFEAVSILEISEAEKSPLLDQVSAAHFNGSSNIQESTIAAVANDLASRADAPAFAYTDIDQVVVVRKYLNRLTPDLVSANGGMTDIEAFVVFTGLLSQKIDNEDFMVAPGQFTANMNNVTGNEIPGRPEHSGEVELSQESAETYQMLNVISGYVNSKNALAGNDIIASIGIQ